MPEGVIQGGWNFVYAAYIFTAAAFSLYALSLVLRMRRALSDGDEA